MSGFGDALRHARDGYAVYPLLAQNIRDHAAEYARWPGNAAIFLPGGPADRYRTLTRGQGRATKP